MLSKPTTFNITLESFARQGKSRRFLQTIENGATFTVAFTGKKSERSASKAYILFNFPDLLISFYFSPNQAFSQEFENGSPNS